MRTWAKASTPAALLAVAVMSFGGGTALADTSGDASVGGGNQVDLPISLPIDISGNSVGAVGSSSASSQGGAEVVNKGGIPGNRTSGNASVLGGNQVNAPISAPVNACGNAVSLVGRSDAGCKGGATVRNQGKGGAGGNRTSGDASVLGGNQITAPISAPINVCGNAVAIFGSATAGCKGGSSVHNTGVGAGGNRTSGNASVLGGNQVVAPISAPVNICGNAVAVVGRAFAGCKGGSTVTNGGGHRNGYHGPRGPVGSSGNDTDGRFGVGSGNQVIAPISVPVNVCGNAVGNAAARCEGGSKVENTRRGSGAGGNVTSGQAGVLSGNQVVAPISAPVNVCGNAVALVGHAFAGCKGGARVKNGGTGAGGNHTSGRAGVLSGNQVIAPITAPINICGNAAAVLGASRAHCKGGAKVDRTGGGGNYTSGRAGVLAGNQIIAPIAAPINVCGNAAAVLGDAAAGCLGGANVGRPEYGHGFVRGGVERTAGKGSKGGLLPMLPAVPVLGGVQDLAGVTQKGNDLAGVPQQLGVTGKLQEVTGTGLTSVPLVEDAAQTFGLPSLPELPGLPGQAQTPAQPKKRHAAGQVDGAGRPVSSSGAVSVLDPATGLVAGTPVGGAVTSATRGLPVSGLMSAEQPAGLGGMNSSSLLALMIGAMFAASATLVGTARRFRIGRK